MVLQEQLEALLQLNKEDNQDAFRIYHTILSKQYGIKVLNTHWLPYQSKRLTIDGQSLNSEYR